MRNEYLNGIEESVVKHQLIVEESVNDLLIRNNLKAILAICGGAEDEESLEQSATIITDLILNTKDIPIAILTGGTKGGIPELGITIAKKALVPTIGVFPPKARKYALLDDLDLAIETLPPSFGAAGFGTETPTYINLADGIAVIGGGFGTLTEVATAFKVNIGRIKKQERPIFICPIQGTGGIADIMQTLPGVDKIQTSLPSTRIASGTEAARFFTANLTK